MTTPNFGHLAKHDINPNKTQLYTFYELEGEPALTVRVVGEKNRPLFKRIQKRAGGANRAPLNVQQIQSKARRNARELFAGSDGCIDGWPTAPLDSDGNPVEFSAENCSAFLVALPDHLLDGLIAYVASSENFTGEDDVTPEQADDLGKD